MQGWSGAGVAESQDLDIELQVIPKGIAHNNLPYRNGFTTLQ